MFFLSCCAFVFVPLSVVLSASPHGVHPTTSVAPHLPHSRLSEKCVSGRLRSREPRSGDLMQDKHSWNPLRHVMIRPGSNTYLMWSVFRFLFALYDILLVPLDVFSLPSCFLLVFMDWLVSCFWIGDVPVSFLTGFFRDGLVEMRPYQTACRYLRTLVRPRRCGRGRRLVQHCHVRDVWQGQRVGNDPRRQGPPCPADLSAVPCGEDILTTVRRLDGGKVLRLCFSQDVWFPL